MEAATETANDTSATKTIFAGGTFQILPLDALADSPFQPERISKRGDLDELAASMGNGVGVIEPLIVRVAPKGTASKSITHEIVAGHRRKRGAAIAGLQHVPCIVRELTDVEVLDLQTIENGQREGLHPLDEADHYLLSIKHGRSVADIADNNGRDRSYIAKRLKLLDLTKGARKAFEEDKLTLGAAIVLARVPQKLQDEALKALTADSNSFMADRGAPVSERKARDLIVDKFMLQLGEAPWKLDDAELVPAAGPCTTCSKRTGNQSELFDDMKSKSLCTDPLCHRSKADALFKIRSKEAEAAGRKVLSAKEAKQAFGYGGGFVRSDDTRYDQSSGKTVNVGVVVKKAEVPTMLAQDPKTGAPVELVRNADFDRAVALQRKTEGKASAPTKGQAYDQKLRAEQRRNKRVVELVLAEAIPKAEKLRAMPQSKGMWLLVAAVFRGFIEAVWSEYHTKVLQRRDPAASAADAEKKLLALFDKSTPAEQLGIAAEIVLVKWAPKPNQRAQWSGLLSTLGVDIAKIEKQVTAEERERAQKDRAAAKKKAAGAAGIKTSNGMKPVVGKVVAPKGKLAAKVAAKKKAGR